MIGITAPNFGNSGIMTVKHPDTSGTAAAAATARIQAQDLAAAIRRAGFKFTRDEKGPNLIRA